MIFMRITVYCKPEEFCRDCKETGGEIPQAPIEFRCMAEKCEHPETVCMFVQHGGVRV